MTPCSVPSNRECVYRENVVGAWRAPPNDEKSLRKVPPVQWRPYGALLGWSGALLPLDPPPLRDFLNTLLGGFVPLGSFKTVEPISTEQTSFVSVHWGLWFVVQKWKKLKILGFGSSNFQQLRNFHLIPWLSLDSLETELLKKLLFSIAKLRSLCSKIKINFGKLISNCSKSKSIYILETKIYFVYDHWYYSILTIISERVLY